MKKYIILLTLLTTSSLYLHAADGKPTRIHPTYTPGATAPRLPLPPTAPPQVIDHRFNSDWRDESCYAQTRCWLYTICLGLVCPALAVWGGHTAGEAVSHAIIKNNMNTEYCCTCCCTSCRRYCTTARTAYEVTKFCIFTVTSIKPMESAQHIMYGLCDPKCNKCHDSICPRYKSRKEE